MYLKSHCAYHTGVSTPPADHFILRDNCMHSTFQIYLQIVSLSRTFVGRIRCILVLLELFFPLPGSIFQPSCWTVGKQEATDSVLPKYGRLVLFNYTRNHFDPFKQHYTWFYLLALKTRWGQTSSVLIQETVFITWLTRLHMTALLFQCWLSIYTSNPYIYMLLTLVFKCMSFDFQQNLCLYILM